MRDIKFRAWDIDRKRMRDIMDIKWFDNGNIRVNATESDKNYEPLLYMKEYNGMELKEFELMQYTGIKDINGTEIYEGDIVQRDSMAPGGRDFLGVVKYDEGCFLLEKGTYSIFLYSQIDELIVAGNKYENPELLPWKD